MLKFGSALWAKMKKLRQAIQTVFNYLAKQYAKYVSKLAKTGMNVTLITVLFLFVCYKRV